MESKFKDLILCEPPHNFAKSRQIYFHIIDSNIDDLDLFYNTCIKNFFRTDKYAGWRRDNISNNILDYFHNLKVMYDLIKNYYSDANILANIECPKWNVIDENFNAESHIENKKKYFIFTLSENEEIDDNYERFIFSFVVKKYPSIEYFDNTINELHSILEHQHNVIEELNKIVSRYQNNM